MQNVNMKDKVALITGGARRIGSVIAAVLHAAGMNIVIQYNYSQEDAERLIEKLNAIRENSAAGASADLLDIESLKLLIQKVVQIWGRLDVVVNNASRFYRTSLCETTDYAWNDLIGINLKVPYFLAQVAAPFLINTKGSIVNITDIHAEKPLKNYNVYCIAKSGLTMTTRVLAKELGPDVRVNAISPGAIIWPEGENSLSEELKQKIIAQSVLKRTGSPIDIAKAVLFVVRDANYMTGQVITIDGGRTL